MSEQKYFKGKLIVDEYQDVVTVSSEGGDQLAEVFSVFDDSVEDNAQRIVSCVNAMAGVDDPEAWLDDLKEKILEIINYDHGDIVEVQNQVEELLEMLPNSSEPKS